MFFNITIGLLFFHVRLLDDFQNLWWLDVEEGKRGINVGRRRLDMGH